MMGGQCVTRDRKRTRPISDFSCFQSLHYNNVQGLILLMHNSMIPIINIKLNNWPCCTLARHLEQHTTLVGISVPTVLTEKEIEDVNNV